MTTTVAPAADGRGVAGYEASDAYPWETFEDIRTFTDAWVAVEVTGERLGAVEGDGNREGYQPRWVTASVTDTLWQRSDVEVPEVLEVETGLFISDFEASHAVGRGSVPLVVGAEVAATTPLVPDTVVDPEARLGRWFARHDDPASPEDGDPGT